MQQSSAAESPWPDLAGGQGARTTSPRNLSLPSLILLKRVVKMPLLVTFTAVVTAGILSIGLIFNATSNWFI